MKLDNLQLAFVIFLVLTPYGIISPAGAAVPEHQAIAAWQGTATCLQCHEAEAQEVFGSTHYQWLGETPYMKDGPEIQGKLDIGVNSYCINITGNWNGCGACHVGLGDRPTPQVSDTQLENIDCLICHQENYQRVKVDGRFIPDLDNMPISNLGPRVRQLAVFGVNDVHDIWEVRQVRRLIASASSGPPSGTKYSQQKTRSQEDARATQPAAQDKSGSANTCKHKIDCRVGRR